jgi:iron complex outermembrane receptor protein
MKTAIATIAERKRSCRLPWSCGIAAMMLVALLGASAGAQTSTAETTTLKGLSLEDLGEIEITSVAKQSQLLSDAPAAIYVITNEEIRRSGYRRLP